MYVSVNNKKTLSDYAALLGIFLTNPPEYNTDETIILWKIIC